MAQCPRCEGEVGLSNTKKFFRIALGRYVTVLNERDDRMRWITQISLCFTVSTLISGCQANNKGLITEEILRLNIEPQMPAAVAVNRLRSIGFDCPRDYNPLTGETRGYDCIRDRSYYVISTCMHRQYFSTDWRGLRVRRLEPVFVACSGI